MERAIEDQKAAEAALKESEEKYRLLVDNAGDAILIAQDGVVKFANPAVMAVTGYTAEEMTTLPFTEFVHPEDRAELVSRYEKRIAGEDFTGGHTFRVLTKGGKTLWAQLNAVRIMWQGKPATLNFIRDITEQRRLESQFQIAQKIEAIGTLAGGIAHDFNNLLMGVQGNVSLLLADMPQDHPERSKLEHIEEYVESGASLTRQLLGFARGGDYEIKSLDLNPIVESTATMFGRTHKEIRLELDLAPDLAAVKADQSQIEQVLRNLAINAWHAMPDGGRLTFATENATVAKQRAESWGVEPGNYSCMTVADTGHGIDRATQLKIFDPFFTTKDLGRGTGLGLASAYGIVRNHGGMITVQSEPGQGASFFVYLPVSDEPVAKKREREPGLASGGATILLVDDEEMILDVSSAMLERLGYRVITANCGRDAVNVFDERHSDIELVILDMIMPEMGGKQTFDELIRIQPDAKILLSSGYSRDGQAESILRAGCCGFLQKPFRLQALSEKLYEVLERGSA